MISTSSALKAAAKAVSKRAYAKLTLASDNLTYDLSANVIQSFTVKRSACVSSTFTLGSAVSSTVDATVLTSAIEDALDTFGADTLDGIQVTAHMGYYTGTNQYATVQVGVFFIDDSATQENGIWTSFKAYDLFYSDSLDAPIDSSYPADFDATLTPYANAQALASIYDGYTYDFTQIASVTGSTPVQITDNLSVREVLGRLAVAAGCNLLMTNTGAISFVRPASTAGETITSANYQNATINGRDTTSVTYIQRSVDTADGAGIQQYPPSSPAVDAGVGLSFDKTFFTGEAPLQEVFNRFTGSGGTFDYQGHNVTICGMPYIEPMDRISFTDTKGNAYSLVPFTVSHTYNGGMKSTLEAHTINKQSVASAQVSSQIQQATSSVSNELSILSTRMGANYGTCPTAGATVAKVAALDSFVLYEGAVIAIKFDYRNAADSPTLSVNGTQALPIYANNKPMPAVSVYNWKDGQVVEFMNARGAWRIIGANLADTCEFNNGVLTISQDSTQEGFHTDIGSDYIALMNGETAGVKLTTGSLVMGSEDNNRYMRLDTDGLAIVNGSARVDLTAQQLILTASEDTAGQAILDSSQLTVAVVEHQQAIFSNSHAVNNTQYVWEKRSNGHFSLKVI